MCIASRAYTPVTIVLTTTGTVVPQLLCYLTHSWTSNNDIGCSAGPIRFCAWVRLPVVDGAKGVRRAANSLCALTRNLSNSFIMI